MRDLVIVDYGAGNLRSVAKAFVALGYAPFVTSDPAHVEDARALVLPGVGAAGQIMRSLQVLELDDAIRRYIRAGRPFLGVCMGMQVLMDWSDEDSGQECLGVFQGRVERMTSPGLKIPHMGWNAVRQVQRHPVWTDIPDQSYFYFVHSFVVQPTDPCIVAGRTDYGTEFVSALASENAFCTQFHPEKSGRLGLQLYRNFAEWASSLYPR